MKLTYDQKQRLKILLPVMLLGLALAWMVRNSAPPPTDPPHGHYNTGPLLKKDGSGCVDASEKAVPCPPGTIFPDTGLPSTSPSGNRMKIPSPPQPANNSKQ